MRRLSTAIVLVLSTLLLVSTSSAQQTTTTAVPNLIRYSGTLKDAQGAASSPTPLGVTFAIYKQQDGGSPFWQETQNVTPDANGQYSAILGSTTSTGLPNDLFSRQEERWLGVQVQGQAEQARVLLVSVPYAFKAHEAETLGGLPPSAFVKANSSDESGSSGNLKDPPVNSLAGVQLDRSGPGPLTLGYGAKGYIAMWLNQVYLGKSAMFQTSAGNVGIGTTTPVTKLDVNGGINSSAGYQISGNGVLLINRTLDNLIVGGDSGSINSGEFNTFSGIDAGFTNNTGYDNTFSGSQAGYANTKGTDNTFTGVLSGARNITGKFNSFFGVFAGLNSNADYNTFIGVDAGFLDTTGSNNTFLGAEAGNSNIGGSFNTFSGRQAGFNATGDKNAFYGYQAGYNSTGSHNTFSGFSAGFSNTADFNSFFGDQAGTSNTSGNENTFVGASAGAANTTGSNNTFFGSGTGDSTTTGSNNTFSGAFAGVRNTTGNYNAFFGNDDGLENTTGYFNAFYGAGAGASNTTGDHNTYLGANAGSGGRTTSASNNIYVGYGAGEGAENGNNNIEIGSFGSPADDGTIRIGEGTLTATYVAGIYDSSAGSSQRTVCVAPNGKLWGSAAGCGGSSRRFKEQIADMGDSSSKLLRLRPVTFFYKPQQDDGTHALQYGLIAEEVAKVYPEMVVYDKDGQPYTVKYQLLAPMLLNELQKQHTVVAAQQDVIKTQQEQINEMQQRLLRLESLIAKK